MARLRHYLTSIGVAAWLVGCGRPPSAPAPVAGARVAVPAKNAAAPEQEIRAPEWQSTIPQIEKSKIAPTLRQAKDALGRGQLERGSSPGPGALELYLGVLAVDPANQEAKQGVQSALDALLERGRLAMRAGNVAAAERVEQIARRLLPGHPDLPVYQRLLVEARAAGRWVQRADAAGKKGAITKPAGRSVLDYLKNAQKTFADFEPAADSAKRWNHELLAKAWKQAQREEFQAADATLVESARLAPLSPEAQVAGLRIIELRQARTYAVLAEGDAAVDKMQLVQADSALAHARRIAAQTSGADALAARIHLARHYGPFKPGQVFSEKLGVGGAAPEMVVIPYGHFTMGSPDSDTQRQENESPAHEVTFERGFAIARNETTVADFKRFIDASHYSTTATRAGHSTVYDEKGGAFTEHEGVDWRNDHVGRVASPALPVVHVTLQDALAYTRWLSLQTGRHYRLPSEAEFEYVLRAGSTDIYPWGKAAPTRIVGNLTGDGDLSRSGRSWDNAIPGYRDAFWGPAPVRNFPAERFGTFDIIGNVSEWTLDCWHDSYQRAPVNGSAWVNPGCPKRVIRGASWGSSLEQARSASRLPMDADSSTARLGFRVAREL
jgi:formylglycine-generating enzyme required for sulfatase activity